jgi:hypothetical protein
MTGRYAVFTPLFMQWWDKILYIVVVMENLT